MTWTRRGLDDEREDMVSICTQGGRDRSLPIHRHRPLQAIPQALSRPSLEPPENEQRVSSPQRDVALALRARERRVVENIPRHRGIHWLSSRTITLVQKGCVGTLCSLHGSSVSDS